MKRKLILLTFTVMFCFIKLNAQNYSPVVNGNTSLFNLFGNIQALHVDSTKADPKGLAHYFLKTFDMENDLNSPCPRFVAAWTGFKMITAGNTYYFFNQQEDTIKILPLNEINVPWKFYKYYNGDYIEATITSKEQMSFLVFADSVKTISLQKKTSAGLNVDDPINTSILQISKQYGFIKMISFSKIPENYSSYELVGLSQPEAGLQLLTPRKIYDFNVNDEFHYKTNYFNVPVSGYSDKTIRKVIGKYTSLNTDTVIYTFQQIKETINYTVINGGTETVASSPIYQITTFDEKHIFNDSVIYPGTYLYKWDYPDSPVSYELHQSASNGNKLILSVNSIYGMTYHYHDVVSCWCPVVDGPTDYISYLEGCGYYEINRDVFPSSNNSKLIYYKKGDDTYGEPLVLSTFTKSSAQALTLYPNPLKQGEDLHISTSHFNATKLLVYNSTGNKIGEATVIPEDLQSLDVSKLQAGFYVVQLLNEKNEFITSKLIIK